MSEKEQALAFLRVASSTCSVALDTLADKETDIKGDETGESVSLNVLLKDYSSLLSFIYQNTAKLSIALKPGSPSYSASTSPLKELTKYVDALTSCACTLKSSEHGRTLVKEVRWSAEEVISALDALLGVFIADAQTPRTGLADSYLVKTGTVHEAIDRAKGIPHTNSETVKRRWEGDLAGIGDCVEEVQEMVDDEEGPTEAKEGSSDGDDEDFVEDDGWGELGVELPPNKTSVKATAEELARLKTACHLLKFTQALQKRVISLLLTSRDIVEAPRASVLDDLLSYSNSLLKASDELVHALYLPQDLENLASRVRVYRAILEDQRGVLYSLLPTSSPTWTRADTAEEPLRRIASLSIQSDDRTAKIAKERKWFDTCFAQIFRSADSITGADATT